MTPSDLPREIAPSRDLWPDIAARLDAPEAPRQTRSRGLAFASLVTIASAAAVLVWLLRPTTDPPPPVSWEPAMTESVDALADTLEARRGQLDPVTIAVVEENLQVIDDAIAETRAALAAAPQDPQLQRLLAGHVHRRADLVDVVRDLPVSP